MAAGSCGLLIALMGYRAPMLVAATLAGFPALLLVNLATGYGFLMSLGLAFVGTTCLQVCYLAAAAILVGRSSGQTAPSDVAAASGRGPVSYLSGVFDRHRVPRSSRLRGD